MIALALCIQKYYFLNICNASLNIHVCVFVCICLSVFIYVYVCMYISALTNVNFQPLKVCQGSSNVCYNTILLSFVTIGVNA